MSWNGLKGNGIDTWVLSDKHDFGFETHSSSYPSFPFPVQSSENIADQNHITFKVVLRNKNKRRQPQEADNKPSQSAEGKCKYPKESVFDPDAGFLMSLLPYVKNIPEQRKLLVRGKLQQVLIDEQTADSSPVQVESSPGHSEQTAASSQILVGDSASHSEPTVLVGDSTRQSVNTNIPQSTVRTISVRNVRRSNRSAATAVIKNPNRYKQHFNPNKN